MEFRANRGTRLARNVSPVENNKRKLKMNAKHYDDRPGHSTTTQSALGGQKTKAGKSRNSATQAGSGQPSSPDGQSRPSQDETRQRKVVFQLGAPAARNVSLAADFTSWDKEPIPMSREEEVSGRPPSRWPRAGIAINSWLTASGRTTRTARTAYPIHSARPMH